MAEHGVLATRYFVSDTGGTAKATGRLPQKFVAALWRECFRPCTKEEYQKAKRKQRE